MKILSSASKIAFIVGALFLPICIGPLDQPAQAQTLLQTWYVDTTCTICGTGTLTSPFKTILQSLTYAGAGDTIFVAQGTYNEHLSIDTPVTIKGGYVASEQGWIRDTAYDKTIVKNDNTGTPGDWDGDWLGSFSVVKDDGTYRMWYTGGNDVDGERIGYADSPDGIDWFRPLSMPLLYPGAEGTWDEKEVSNPFVTMTANGFQMWYVGVNKFGQRGIGTAFSSDGLTWQKNSSNPLLRQDAADEDLFGFPKVVQSSPDDYKMWYSGEGQIWLALSSDGLHWTKNLSVPALAPGSDGSWDDAQIYAPDVHVSLVEGGYFYEMWYVGEGTTVTGSHIGYAWSTDGLTWTKSPNNPVLSGEASAWENENVTYPVVIKENSTEYIMWYRGGVPDAQGYGQAISTDGVNWIKYDRAPILAQGRPTVWGSSVIVLLPESSEAVLDGLTITGGFAEYGGGLYMIGGLATIHSCTVIENIAKNSGAGIYISSGAPLIEDTVVNDNTTVSGWAGGIYVGHASPILSGTAIINNEARDAGGGMIVRGDSQLTIIASTIARNLARRAGGILLNGSNLNIESSQIVANSAEQTAGMRVESDSTLWMTNTFVTDNAAIGGSAGGLHFRSSTGRLMNVTVAGNNAGDGVDGISFVDFESEQHLEIINSILVFNGTDDISCSEGSCNITYSDVLENIVGDGNMSVDPQFVDLTIGNYHLRINSPVIDAGTFDGAPTLDFEGDPRSDGIDMGADEYKSPTYSQYVYLPLVMR